MKKQSKKHQNPKYNGEKLKTKGLMFFVSFFSCDLRDSKPSGDPIVAPILRARDFKFLIFA